MSETENENPNEETEETPETPEVSEDTQPETVSEPEAPVMATVNSMKLFTHDLTFASD